MVSCGRKADYSNSKMFKRGLGWRGRFFLFFFLDDRISASEVFCSCAFIPRAHFETSLVMVSCYG